MHLNHKGLLFTSNDDLFLSFFKETKFIPYNSTIECKTMKISKKSLLQVTTLKQKLREINLFSFSSSLVITLASNSRKSKFLVFSHCVFTWHSSIGCYSRGFKKSQCQNHNEDDWNQLGEDEVGVDLQPAVVLPSIVLKG